MPGELLVTGCYRSGTTLLEKLLHAHPRVCVASQPFPVLWARAKQAFDDAREIGGRYPLGHRFGEQSYTDADLAAFLDALEFDDASLDQLFEALSQYTEGLWTPEILDRRSSIRPGPFMAIYRALLGVVAELFPKKDLALVGSKEILIEEFVPYLLDRGVRVILIVRDPRDMIASLNFNARDNATGSNRPVLYSMRLWRKSVATALAFTDHPGFSWMRYEDLVHDPAGCLAPITAGLNLEPHPSDTFGKALTDQRGHEWKGNSSFDDQPGVSASSVGRYTETLPDPVRAFIESTGAPEMQALRYPGARFTPSAIADYCDPFESIHGNFPADYSSDAARLGAELDRHTKLVEPAELDEREAARWFIYPAAYRRLRKAARSTDG